MVSVCCLCGNEGDSYLSIGIHHRLLLRVDMCVCRRHATILVGCNGPYAFLRLNDNANLIDFRHDARLAFGESCFKCRNEASAIVHWKPQEGQRAVPGMYVCQKHFDFLSINRGTLQVKQGLEPIRTKFTSLQKDPFSAARKQEDIWGIFWDYENVPLRKVNDAQFLEGLKAFIQQHEIAFAKVYCHANVISKAQQQDLQSSLRFTIKIVKNSAPNASDASLMRSCLDVLKHKPEITHVLLLTGDIDYTVLTNQLLQQGKAVILIGHKYNYNLKLVQEVHELLSVSLVASFPSNWWTREPLAELDSIARLADPSNPACIEQLLAHLDTTKPYQAAIALTGLGEVICNTSLATNAKTGLARVQEEVLRFQHAAEGARQKDLVERANLVLSECRKKSITLSTLNDEQYF
jgi:hypothetical protein